MLRTIIALALAGVSTAFAQFGPEGRAMWAAAGIRWAPAPGMPMPGMQQAVLLGDPSSSGRYTIRLRLPAGYALPPHVYDQTREVTVLSGVLRFSYGDKYRPEGLTDLPAGSFYVEPANVPAFLEVKEPVELQITGEGPTRPPRLVANER